MRCEDQEQWWDVASSVVNCPEALEWLTEYIDTEDLKVALKNSDDFTIFKLLNKAWWRLPDIPEIHHLPCFYRVCDLCSEYDELFN